MARVIPTLAQCRYSAFISYAHADDVACFEWITLFSKELQRGLAATLRGVNVPPVHLSGDNGPVSGVLEPELQQRIDTSFAMVVVVHDNYVLSQWCLKELEYFRQRFGEEGCRERLYIVALSEPAVLAVAASAAWRKLLPAGQLWVPFFDEDKRHRPIDIYLAPQLVAPRFKESFLRLREDFTAKLKASAAAPAQAIVEPASAAAGAGAGPAQPAGPALAAGSKDACIYIESNRHELTLWQPMGDRMRKLWDQLATAHGNGGGRAPALELRARGLPVEQIDQYPMLDDADGVVLLWGRKTPDALVAQINKVENKMSPGRDAAPGMVAYLMPPQQSAEPVPAWGWQVLRFHADTPEGVDVVPDESDELEGFLRRVLERRLQRDARSEAAAAVAP